ncbi:hypothetical protein [Janibacter cremeus]|uniref:Uncharacterized protein n=1 Tax=Janibacter cremeus TaxID=1285192 RepID=A0A852VN68_9MICO|nr:hypothetical protein [Janibacter cremeus]NYF97566.1 hypothetical protein [Janibacter cremeus]
MSDGLPDPRPPRRPPPSLFSLWGRETVKDMILLVAAVPVLVCLLLVPVVATSGGSWPGLLGLLLLFAASWWIVRLVLRRWVAAGTGRGESPPSHR